VRAALLAEQEARAHSSGDRAGIERSAHALLVNDPAGREYWDFDRSPNALDQVGQRRRTADVPAGLDAFRL